MIARHTDGAGDEVGIIRAGISGKMKAEKFLRQLKSCEEMIRRGMERIQEMELALYPSGISYDGIRVQTSPHDTMSEGVARIVDEMWKLEIRIARDMEKKRAVDEVISQLDPVKIQLIYLRYKDGLSMEKIADKIGYSYRQTYRLWEDALKEVEAIINAKDFNFGGDDFTDADDIGES